MTMSQHTPGPWFYSSGAVWADPEETICIARRDSKLSVHPHRALLPTTKDANMHLIAAAPEMLECLRHILDLADENAKGIDGYEQIAEWSRNLLAKVEGKE